MIIPFWAAQNPSLWISHFPEFFFAFPFLGNFLSSGRGHEMGSGYTLSTTILHYNFWKRRGSFLGLSECRGFLEVLYHRQSPQERGRENQSRRHGRSGRKWIE